MIGIGEVLCQPLMIYDPDCPNYYISGVNYVLATNRAYMGKTLLRNGCASDVR